MRRTVLAFEPERTLILQILLNEEAPLLDRGAAAFDAEAHAFRAILELYVRNLDFAAVRVRFPIRLEIFALKAGAANLFGKEPILYGMVDMFEKMPVDPLIDWGRDPVRVDQQDSNPRLASNQISAG